MQFNNLFVGEIEIEADKILNANGAVDRVIESCPSNLIKQLVCEVFLNIVEEGLSQH